MSDKAAVLTRYPNAVCEIDPPGSVITQQSCAVWDAPRTRGEPRGLWGQGRTPAEAWANTRRTIEEREGRKLTP